VDAAGLLPVVDVSEVHAGAIDVVDGAAGVGEGSGDEGEALLGLIGDAGVVGSDGAGAGDMNVIADADGSGEADDGFEGEVPGCSVGWRMMS